MHTGIALVTGTEDRQWLYPAMTRGTDANLAYVFTTPTRPADPQPGTRSAPELDRYDRVSAANAPDTRRPPPSGAQPGQAGPARADRRARRRAQPRRRRTIRLRDPAAQPGQRRPPRHPPRHLDRRNPSRPPRPLPRPGHGRAPARPPAAAARTRPGGCSAPCTPPNSPAWTPPRSSAPPSPPATWPDPATSPPSWTPGSARASTRCSLSRKAPGPDGYPSCPTRTATPTWPRSPR